MAFKKFQRSPVEAIQYLPTAPRIAFVRKPADAEMKLAAQRRKNFEEDASVKEIVEFVEGTVGAKGQKNSIGMTAGWGRDEIRGGLTSYLISVETLGGTMFAEASDWLVKDGKAIIVMTDKDFKARFGDE